MVSFLKEYFSKTEKAKKDIVKTPMEDLQPELIETYLIFRLKE